MGLRTNSWLIAHSPVEDSSIATSSMGGPVPDLSKTAFDPSLSARYQVNDRLDFRGSIYKAFRAPA